MAAKKTLMFIAVLVFLSAVSAPAGTTLPNVVAVVNGEKITKEQLTSILIDWEAPLVLDEMITFRLVGQEARKAGVKVTEAQVRAKLEERKRELPPGQDFEQMLRRIGLTPGHAFAIIKMQLQAESVLRKSFKVTGKELEDYRRASHILIKVPYAPPGQEDKESPKDKEAKDKIEKIAQEIKDGLAFEEAAKKYSEDDVNKNQGGDLGFFTRGDMLPEFSKVVFEMKPGEVSAPVKTTYGYHLIKLVALGKETKGEEREKLKDMMFQRKIGELYRDWILSIKNKAEVENALEPKSAVKPKPVQQPEPEPVVEPESTPPSPPADASELQPSEMPPPPPPEPAPAAPSDSAQPSQSAPAESPAPAK